MHKFLFQAVMHAALMTAGVAAGGPAPTPAPPPTEKPKSFRLKPSEKALLLEIASKDQNDPFIVQDRNHEDVQALLKHKLLMFDEMRASGENNKTVPAIVNDAGKAKANSYSKSEGKPEGERLSPDSFTLEADIPPPESRRGAARGSVYPFDKMELNASFFIPPSDNTENVSKSKQSSVSQANKKAAKDFEDRKAAGDPEANAEGAQPRKWIIRPWKQKNAEGTEIEGARVWRVQ